MEKLLLKFNNTKPISVNHHKGVRIKYTLKGRKKVPYVDFYLTKPYEDMKKLIHAEMAQRMADVSKFASTYCRTSQVINAKIVYFMPTERLFTLKGELKKQGYDLDNCLKTLLDPVFENLRGLDDAFIFQIRAIKRQSPDENFHIQMELRKDDLQKYLAAPGDLP